VFDPATATFQPAGTLQGGAILLPDGRVLLADGGDGSSSRVEIFDPPTGSLTPGKAMPRPPHAASISLPDGDILITGGLGESGRGLSATAIYDPGSGDWRPGPPMGTPRFKHAVTMLDAGRALVLGGTTDDTELLTSTEILDLATMRFSPGPPMTAARYKFPDAVVRTTTGRLVVGAGTHVDVMAADGQTFQAVTAGPPTRRWVPTVTALPDGSVLVVGGYDDRINLHPDAHIITIGA
jgi:hypothetical protein